MPEMLFLSPIRQSRLGPIILELGLGLGLEPAPPMQAEQIETTAHADAKASRINQA